ncbi:MAG: acyl-CoA dehydrogenase [Acidimicrobiia bacterium]|nr:MAG: acyl-CoA dehydrogenase [Acidimicrobiia bacterium]
MEQLPEQVRDRITQLLEEHPPDLVSDVEFWGAQFDLGLAWVHFPEGKGGLGLEPGLQAEIDRVLEEAGAPSDNRIRNILGWGMGAPVLIAHGTPEQQDRWLRKIFTCEEIWCQLFSEPDAGSDVAALATRAVRDGDEWVVNGQKVWTTLAHEAKWGMLIARTDPDVPKHKGITYFIIDMRQPGVEVKPLRQITGEAEFNEVYFNDARVPDSNRIGAVGDGWRVAIATLMNERVAIGTGTVGPRGSGAIEAAVEAWKAKERNDPAVRDELMSLWVEAEVLRLTNLRARELARAGTPGPEGSTAKIHWAELNKRIYSFAVNLLGGEGMLYPEGYEFRVPDRAGLGRRSTQMSFLRSRANSIEGGTTEILKNVLGERVLGLPGEPRVDKDLPWREIPRG